jgi:ABC-type Fe3+-citrate transport system substrate-binding protein
MKSNSLTIVFFILLIAACSTSSNNDNDVDTTELQDIEQETQVDYMLRRDQERMDSMENSLLKNIED